MFLKKTITFLVSLLSVRKQRKEPCIVFLSTPSWWPILSGTHGATVLDVSTWLSLSTPAHCGTYTFYLSGIKIPSPSPDQSARSNLAAKEKANDVFWSKFRSTFTKDGDYALANWFGSSLFRHYQRKLLCKRHRKYNIYCHTFANHHVYIFCNFESSLLSIPQESFGDFFAILSKLLDQKCWDLLYQHKHPSKFLLPFELKW